MKDENFILCKDLKMMSIQKNARQNLFKFSRNNNFRFSDDVTDEQGH